MSACCPKRQGCNSPGGETCALDILRELSSQLEEAQLAMARWRRLEEAGQRHSRESELRFLRRSYERVRDHALIAFALQMQPTRSGAAALR